MSVVKMSGFPKFSYLLADSCEGDAGGPLVTKSPNGEGMLLFEYYKGANKGAARLFSFPNIF